MKHSIRLKITFLLTVSLVLTIFLCWTLNNSFLVDYYQYEKIRSLDNVYNEINSLIDSKEKIMTEEMVRHIDRLTSNNGVNASIFARKGLTGIYQSNSSFRDYTRVLASMQAYMFANNPELHISNVTLVKTVGNSYDIFKQTDDVMSMNYLDLFGILDSGHIIFLRTNYEGLASSSRISNNFLAIVGVIVTILGSFVMFMLSRRFTRPILILENIAKRMSDLDFDAKYEVKSNDEIGRLGTSINTLSEKLQTTITELKNANNELQSDNERKTQIDEMRKEFLSNVTHELKTPIALIQGYAEGLKENVNDDPESRDFYCEVIMDEAMKMNNMVKKLLSLNQLEFGNNPIDITRFDIVTVIKSVLSSTDILMKQKGITVYFEETEPCYVWADEYMIEEVITNYISNAINHASGAKIIEIKLFQKDHVVRVAVFNTGELIPEEELEKVWIKFYKVDKARTREYGGNGIGLSIVKAIMNSHNKSCGCTNRKNGVEFWFELDSKSN
ncbi:MAG: HAMP domain-containing sensor histidine kinase [Clostridiales bacterium]|nr:HAMP domain-containing sensor histidine kinase [Clostridiales bacterium]